MGYTPDRHHVAYALTKAEHDALQECLGRPVSLGPIQPHRGDTARHNAETEK